MKVVADTLVGEMSKDELVELIIAIDEEVGEWDFTERLSKHFGNLGNIAKLERALDASRRRAHLHVLDPKGQDTTCND